MDFTLELLYSFKVGLFVKFQAMHDVHSTGI